MPKYDKVKPPTSNYNIFYIHVVSIINILIVNRAQSRLTVSVDIYVCNNIWVLYHS